MTRTLITAKEVLMFSPEVTGLSESVVRRHIRREEVNFARKWLGWEFYEDLINDSYDLDSVQDWKEATTYAQNEVVQCYGILYKSTAAGNQGNQPSTSAQWVKISKMKTAEYAELYDCFLLDYLAYLLSAAAIEYSKPLTGKGLTDVNNDGEKSSSIARQTLRENKTLGYASETLDNLAWWMLEEKWGNQETAYDKALIIYRCKRVIKTRPKRRRIALHTMPVTGTLPYQEVELMDSSYTLLHLNQSFSNTQSNVLEWTQNNGNIFDTSVKGTVFVFQNGNKLDPQLYAIADNGSSNDTVTIEANTHFTGANYEIVSIGRA